MVMIRTVPFSFPMGLGFTVTGTITYHYENYGEDADGNRGERTLFIDEVIFDQFDHLHLDEFSTAQQYAYLVERAKESCYFD